LVSHGIFPNKFPNRLFRDEPGNICSAFLGPRRSVDGTRVWTGTGGRPSLDT